jgi:DNA-binding NarL/FixJ family response regulator
MKQKTLVALYGHDLVVSAIGACLEQKPEFQVIRIEGALADDLKRMDALRPDVVLFDLRSTQAHFGISLMHHYPEILLVGVDLTNHTMLVLSGASSRLLTIEDLVEGIEKRHLQPTSDP